jgi:GNAT superfamily N-acetyltransferase
VNAVSRDPPWSNAAHRAREFVQAVAIMRNMSFLEPAIRPAEESDGPAIAAIYAPYVRETAISFETEPPTAATMGQRIARTLETHPWLVADHRGETVGFAYAGKHRERAAYRWTVDVAVYVSGAMRRNGVGHAPARLFEKQSSGFLCLSGAELFERGSQHSASQPVESLFARPIFSGRDE